MADRLAFREIESVAESAEQVGQRDDLAACSTSRTCCIVASIRPLPFTDQTIIVLTGCFGSFANWSASERTSNRKPRSLLSRSKLLWDMVDGLAFRQCLTSRSTALHDRIRGRELQARTSCHADLFDFVYQKAPYILKKQERLGRISPLGDPGGLTKPLLSIKVSDERVRVEGCRRYASQSDRSAA